MTTLRKTNFNDTLEAVKNVNLRTIKKGLKERFSSPIMYLYLVEEAIETMEVFTSFGYCVAWGVDSQKQIDRLLKLHVKLMNNYWNEDGTEKN